MATPDIDSRLRPDFIGVSSAAAPQRLLPLRANIRETPVVLLINARRYPAFHTQFSAGG
jgi:hypothetical protein